MHIEKKETGIILIKNAVSPEILTLVTEYALLREKTKRNSYRHADPLKNVHREYGDPLMEVLLQRFTPLVEQAVGVPLWPTLSFYYTYKHGNQLLAHTDRSSCQIVAGLCIGVDEAFKKSHGTWPLWFHVNGEAISYEVGEGDLLIFRGAMLEHWRDKFAGEWFISAIFGFVEKQGPFAFQKYDQRRALGLPHVGMFSWAWGCLKARFLKNFIQQ